MADLVLRGVRKIYAGGVVGVQDLDLEVERGELISLLGPSGCGKTTTLRLIAGFLEPDAGSIEIKGRDVSGIPPHRRDIGLVFQNYSLFPHMRVFDNIAYGLRMRKVPGKEIKDRVLGALDLVGLDEVTDRYPAELSGGQQQRVALARAIVIRPSVLLLDEPLSNLDANLRHQTRWEIRRLQKELGITTVLVTHDQDEALTICDRVAVMSSGRIEQNGAPKEIYGRPRTLFVAAFVGDSNLLAGHTAGPEFVTRGGLRIPLSSDSGDAETAAHLSIRPEAIRVVPPEETDRVAGLATLPGVVESADYLGHSISLRVRLPDATTIRVVQLGDGAGEVAGPLWEGAEVIVAWKPGAARLIVAS